MFNFFTKIGKKTSSKKTREFLNKKFFLTIFFILFFGLSIIFYFYQEKKKFNEEKRFYIGKILKSSLESYKEIYGFYPENLEELEKDNILKPVNLLISGQENYFIYQKTSTGYIFFKK